MGVSQPSAIVVGVLPNGAGSVSMLTVYPWGWATSWIASLLRGGF
jgi:hypothetical protein